MIQLTNSKNQNNAMAILLFMVFSWSIGISAEEIDNENPEVRQEILRKASKLFSQRKIEAAATFYKYGIDRWDQVGQAADREKACRGLLGLLVWRDSLEEGKELVDNCPTEITSFWFSKDDRSAIPVLKFSPYYPKDALDKGLEGWVLVEFDVKKNGRVSGVSVVESSDSLFEKPAIRSAKKNLYLPAIKNGKYVKEKGVISRIRFELTDM